MKNTCSLILVAILAISTAGPAAESGESSVAIITGEVRDPTSREITFRYDTPTALGRKVERKVTLDSRNRFALEIPVVRGTLVRGSYKGRSVPWKWVRQAASYVVKRSPLVLFVEPGDSLHIRIHPGHLSTSCRFSGRNADNSRFIVEWYPRLRNFQRKIRDSRDMDAGDFSRLVDGWHGDQIEFLNQRRTRYALSPGFIEHAERYFNYTYAFLKISYPANYRRATGRENKKVPPEFYDFLKQIPLVDEKAIGVDPYSTYLVRTLDLELMKMPRSTALSDLYDLTSLDLSKETRAGLDSLYARFGWHPGLSKMIDLSTLGLPEAISVKLDSMYASRRKPTLSQMFDLEKMGLSKAARARLDSFYQRSDGSYRIATSSKLEKPEIDTTGGALVFRLPAQDGASGMEGLRSFKRKRKLSDMVDLAGLDLSTENGAYLDSLYENRQPLRLSRKLDLSGMGLSQAVQTRLDSIYAIKRRSISALPRRFDLAEEKLKGRVRNWFLAGQLISGFQRGGASFAAVNRMWKEFQATNPYPEYNAAVLAALDKAMALRPGRPAPDFTLRDLDGQPVSLSQFRGNVVLLDFWASWCGPCIGNLPYLRKIKKKTAGQPVVFVNLSLDSNDAAWRKAIEEHGIEGVHVRSGVSGSGPASDYNVRGIPAYFLVDPQGRILKRLSQVELKTDMDGVVAKILKSLGSV
ncbi:MAG: TlpA disulfide reductase family protein [Gemmatimonadetes bacterium]|nr:TlpA disulfide reductase family protein [Gemmatimonadota bacterium]